MTTCTTREAPNDGAPATARKTRTDRTGAPAARRPPPHVRSDLTPRRTCATTSSATTAGQHEHDVRSTTLDTTAPVSAPTTTPAHRERRRQQHAPPTTTTTSTRATTRGGADVAASPDCGSCPHAGIRRCFARRAQRCGCTMPVQVAWPYVTSVTRTPSDRSAQADGPSGHPRSESHDTCQPRAARRPHHHHRKDPLAHDPR